MSLVTTKVRKESLKKLRCLKLLTGKTGVELIDRALQVALFDILEKRGITFPELSKLMDENDETAA